MIELADGIWVTPEHITMIKEEGKDKCLLFFVGQSALEGHVLPYAASEVAEIVEDYFSDEVEDEEED